jgi:hypothetical protein
MPLDLLCFVPLYVYNVQNLNKEKCGYEITERICKQINLKFKDCPIVENLKIGQQHR